jgi:glycosyltransferase involved in cell wall biosynthesis
MKFGIVIPTYYRKDKTTKFYLTRALNSVLNQKYKNFKIYLIGDRYEDEEEINELVSKYESENFYFENLKVAKERDFYTNKYAVWSYGGVNATNYGIDISLSEGNEYICHLDHDDYWSETHLETIKNCIDITGSDWVCTKSIYVDNRILPVSLSTEKYINFLPKPESLIHSSVCMNFKKIPLKYRDLFAETGKIGLPTDAELWYRSGKYIIENNLKSTLINEITCYHIEEGYERK